MPRRVRSQGCGNTWGCYAAVISCCSLPITVVILIRVGLRPITPANMSPFLPILQVQRRELT